MIYVATSKSQMEAYRRSARSQYGDKYPQFVAPYKSLIEKEFRRAKGQKSLEECARELLGILKGSPKMKEKFGRAWNHFRAVLFSAALDLKDEGLER